VSRVSPLATEFVERHPADAARILEQLPAESVSFLLGSIELPLASRLIECMVVPYGAECLRHLAIDRSSVIVKEINTTQAARLLRTAGSQTSAEIFNLLPDHIRTRIKAVSRYPEQTVGTVMDYHFLYLPMSISITDAIRRVRHAQERIGSELFVVDDTHKLVGAISLAQLFSVSRSLPVQTVMMHDVPFLYARTPLQLASQHAGWHRFETLPVVDQDHIVMGVLNYRSLAAALNKSRQEQRSDDVLNSIFSVAHVYWIVIAELIGTLAKRNEPEQ